MVTKEFFLQMVSGKTTPPIEAIEEFTSRYPWCALGHKSLFTALCGESEEAYLSYISRASVYLFNREELYTLVHTPRPRAALTYVSKPFLIEKPEKKKVVEKREAPKICDDEEFEMISDTDFGKQVVVAGGDYFGPDVLNTALLEERNPIDKFIKTNPKITPVQMAPEEKGGVMQKTQGEKRGEAQPLHDEKEKKISLQDVGEDNFMTETLAKIYADQSLYQLAIEAYQKLILLYPKKSDYFAPLIQDLKYKMVR